VTFSPYLANIAETKTPGHTQEPDENIPSQPTVTSAVKSHP